MLEQAIKEILGGDSTISGLVGTRIRPMIASQDDVNPRLTYRTVGDDPIDAFDGASSFSTAQVEIDVIGDTFTACANLAAEVKRVMNGVAVNTTTVRICPSKLTDQTDVEEAFIEGTEVPVFLRTQTYQILYRALP